jgi:hypothetical protein
VSPLERRARWLLRVYPAAYRRERAEEIIGTLLEATPEGRAWPRVRDARALVGGGIRARRAQNRQRTTAANVRVAVMAGVTIYLSLWVSAYLGNLVSSGWSGWSGSGWSALATDLLYASTVLLAWMGSRAGVIAAATAGSAAVAYFALVSGGMRAPDIVAVLCLAALAALTRRAERPSLRWLWLPGVIVMASTLVDVGARLGWLSALPQITGLLLLSMGAVGLLWIAIDARLIVALLTYFAVGALQVAIPYGPLFVSSLPLLLIIAALMVAAVWVLRRQSALRQASRRRR